MSATAKTEIILIQTVPTAHRLGTINGMPMLDEGWHDLNRELRTLKRARLDQLAAAGVRQIEVHQGKTIFTLHTPAGTMATMARAAVSHLAWPEQIINVWAQPTHAIAWVDTTDGVEIYEVVDLQLDSSQSTRGPEAMHRSRNPVLQVWTMARIYAHRAVEFAFNALVPRSGRAISGGTRRTLYAKSGPAGGRPSAACQQW